jgi:hypothetical protein
MQLYDTSSEAGLRIEVAVIVCAAHQKRAVAATLDLANMWRDVSDGDADAPTAGAIRPGTMGCADVVQ